MKQVRKVNTQYLSLQADGSRCKSLVSLPPPLATDPVLLPGRLLTGDADEVGFRARPPWPLNIEESVEYPPFKKKQNTCNELE